MSDDQANAQQPTPSSDGSGGGGGGALIPVVVLVVFLGVLGFWAYNYIFEDPTAGSGIDRSQPYVVEIDQDNPPAESNVPGGGGGGGGGGNWGGGGDGDGEAAGRPEMEGDDGEDAGGDEDAPAEEE